ncbi:MAG: transcriptional repressor LexA [Clostridiales bacterium]|nr:transcriptional repressor LexA [Clostridiales bacterium]
MAHNDLTARQAAIFDYIKQEISQKGYPPAVREIGEAVGLSSPSSVHAHLNTLEQLGYIRRDQSKPRALEVLDGDNNSAFPQKEMVQVPILGSIAAGMPALAEENFEDIFPIPLEYLGNSKRQLFMLHVKGESMIEVGIEHGDLLVVEEAITARNGDIVVALIDNEATVKTFYRENGYIRLQPENSGMEPIIVADTQVIGKPIALFRRL